MNWTDCLHLIEIRNAPLHPKIPPSDFHNNILISPRYNYLFVNNPKVACTTTKKLLIDAEFGKVKPFAERAPTLHYNNFLPFLNPWQLGDFPEFVARPEVFKFCFVRNPYTRLLSGYLDKVVRGEMQKNNILKFLGKEDAPETEIDFGTFVRVVCAMPVASQDPHWRVQYYHTCQEGIKFDFIGKFENLEQDLRTVAEQLGISNYINNETFGRAGRTSRQHATGSEARLEEFYTPELKMLVQEAYVKDFEAFGYEM